ncbi:MAG: hypothetical protein QM771_00565 [Nitrospira sp.]
MSRWISRPVPKKLFPDRLIIRAVVSGGGAAAPCRNDTKSLDALNRLGLAPASEAAKQKKQLHHYARLNARQLLAWDEAKGVTVKRILADGSPFEEIARTARVEGV